MLIHPSSPRSSRNRHDVAYACFLPPLILSLISTVGTVIPMSTGVAGGVGFLLLVPLAFLAIVSVPIGIYLSLVLRKDIVLPLLSVLTILRVAQVLTEAGSVAFSNATGSVYGVVGAGLVASWFLVRRWRASAT